MRYILVGILIYLAYKYYKNDGSSVLSVLSNTDKWLDAASSFQGQQQNSNSATSRPSFNAVEGGTVNRWPY